MDKKLNPEATIFYRKKAMAERLLKISVEDLKNAPEQPWYYEYLALLAIRIQDPSLNELKKSFVEDLISSSSSFTCKSPNFESSSRSNPNTSST